MPNNESNLFYGNGDLAVEDLIEKIKHLDSAVVIDPVYDNEPHPNNVEETLNRLRTLQIIKDTQETAKKLSKFQDAFQNPAARTGWGEDNLINATEYPMTRLTQDWQLLTSLYRTSWIVQRVCNAIPEDALASLSIEAPGLETKEIHRLEEEIRSTHLRESILEGLRWGRLYGGAAAIIMLSGQEEDLSLPIDINNIMPGAFRGLYVVDRWSGIYPGLDLVDNDRDPDFGLPDYYEVRDETSGGTYRVHHSRVLCFRGTQMPYWEEIAEQYWGTSAIESMYDELIKRDNVAHNIANLTFKACLSVLQVENLDQMFATSSSVHQRRMYAMLSAINTLENSLGIRLVNKGDDIQQLQYSFSGLPEVMDSAMMDMAGATGIPVTRLFGRSPAGMNSTGESDERMYRQALEQERSIHIVPVLERLIPIICRSAIGYFPAGCEFKLPALLEVPPDQKAQLIDQRVGVMERLFQANLVPGDAVLESLRTAQQEMDITTNITDEYINHVKGKYFNDLQQQADPYGGAMQTASEAGVDSGTEEVDENGNPIEPAEDEEGQPQIDENGNPIPEQQQPEEPETPEERRAIEKQSAKQQLPINEFAEQMNQRQEALIQAQQGQEQMEEQAQAQAQEQEQEQEQRRDYNSMKYRKIKHLRNIDDEDFRYEKFKKTNVRNKRDKWN
jgi:phage-related protein (TIGR01555 family)